MHNDWQARINNGPRPFNLVSQNLRELGSLSIDRYLSASSSELLATDFAQPTTPETSIASPITKPHALPATLPQVNQPVAVPSPAVKMQHVARLHQACQHAFGGGQALKFDFMEENGPKSKQCILTITRPNGSVRSYQTEPVFARKNDAKAQAAKIAVDMGALEFIQTGDSDALKAKKGFLLSPFDNVDPSQRGRTSLSPTEPPEDDKLIKEIENSCIRWRPGEVTPQWFFYRDSKESGQCGAALRIMLSMHAFRVYSSDTTYSSHCDAKAACAKTAIDEGVLDYLKRGNGHFPPSDPAGGEQNFYDGLPKPFPEVVGDKTALEINGPAWLNTTIQTARGGRLKATFHWLMDGSAGLHGCLLRLERPGECRSYLVDTRFYKRADAKAAVCLLAMSQGVGNYIREVGAAAQTKLSDHFKTLAHQHIYPQLRSEGEKIRPGNHPIYTTFTDRDAFGCTLEVDISSSADQRDIREYKVEPEYRTKADAKIAVACLAAEQGLFELLRFRGEPPPAGYRAFWELHNQPAVIEVLKRKELDNKDVVPAGSKSKRQRIDLPDDQEEVNNGNPKPTKKGSRKKLSASGSRGLVSLGSSAQTGGSTDSNPYGNRSVGNSMAPYGGSEFDMAGPSAPFNPLYAPLPTHGWPNNGPGPYHFFSHPVATPFQQQNPFAPTQFVGDASYPAPSHGPPSSNYFQGHGIPLPVPYGSYPQYPIHHPPFPGPGNYGYSPNLPSFPHQAALPPSARMPPVPQMAKRPVGNNVDPRRDLGKRPETIEVKRSGRVEQTHDVLRAS